MSSNLIFWGLAVAEAPLFVILLRRFDAGYGRDRKAEIEVTAAGSVDNETRKVRR